jgi:hypothetical protein
MLVKFQKENGRIAINPDHVVEVSPDDSTVGYTFVALSSGKNIHVKGDFEAVIAALEGTVKKQSQGGAVAG